MGGVVNPAGVVIQDEGITQGVVDTINFAGAGVTAAVAGSSATVTVSGGGAGSANFGTAVIDFGAAPGTNIVTVVVTGQASIAANSHIFAFVMGEATAEHNIYEHQVAPIKLTPGLIVPGTGFTITAVTEWRLTGRFNIHWTWS